MRIPGKRLRVALGCALCLLLAAGCSPRGGGAEAPAEKSARPEAELAAPQSPAEILPETAKEKPEAAEEEGMPESRGALPEEKAAEAAGLPDADVSAPEKSPPRPVEAEAAFEVSVPDDGLLERINGVSWMPGPLPIEDLRLVEVTYVDFDGVRRRGELLVHRELAQETADIFRELYEAGFPLQEVALIDKYGADDDASMQANNTYSFCTRLIYGAERYSPHSLAAAVDINPVMNPYVLPGSVEPPAAAEYMDRGDVRPGMVTPGDACYNAFVSRGWTWGGHWARPDYQHFEKMTPEQMLAINAAR